MHFSPTAYYVQKVITFCNRSYEEEDEDINKRCIRRKGGLAAASTHEFAHGIMNSSNKLILLWNKIHRNYGPNASPYSCTKGLYETENPLVPGTGLTPAIPIVISHGSSEDLAETLMLYAWNPETLYLNWNSTEDIEDVCKFKTFANCYLPGCSSYAAQSKISLLLATNIITKETRDSMTGMLDRNICNQEPETTFTMKTKRFNFINSHPCPLIGVSEIVNFADWKNEVAKPYEEKWEGIMKCEAMPKCNVNRKEKTHVRKCLNNIYSMSVSDITIDFFDPLNTNPENADFASDMVCMKQKLRPEGEMAAVSKCDLVIPGADIINCGQNAVHTAINGKEINNLACISVQPNECYGYIPAQDSNNDCKPDYWTYYLDSADKDYSIYLNLYAPDYFAVLKEGMIEEKDGPNGQTTAMQIIWRYGKGDDEWCGYGNGLNSVPDQFDSTIKLKRKNNPDIKDFYKENSCPNALKKGF